MKRAEAVALIRNGIREVGTGMTRCVACGLDFAAAPEAHFATHNRVRGYAFWQQHKDFLRLVPVAERAPMYLRNGGRVEKWILARRERVLEAGWAARSGETLLVPMPLWDLLHDMTRKHRNRREENTEALLDDMIAEALKGDAP